MTSCSKLGTHKHKIDSTKFTCLFVCLSACISHKNSPGDEIANVNFLRRYRTHISKYQKRELTSFNKLDGKYCALRLEFMNLLQNFHLAVIEYLYRGRRAVPLQTFTTRHNNRKLSLVMALSTTFTQCARKIPNSVK